jgi:2'-5' RNA ligase
MPTTTRTFVGIAIPPSQGEKLARLQERLAQAIPGVRWSASSPFHMTLAFLGDVRDGDLNAVCTAVAEACSPFPAFDLQLQGVGVFPSPARPRVIWAGLLAPDGSPLFDLYKAITKGLTRVGHRPEGDRFTPHATLGRIRQDRRGSLVHDLTAALQPVLTWSGGSFPVSEVVTFASTLSPEGPVYAPLARSPLSGKKTTPET